MTKTNCCPGCFSNFTLGAARPVRSFLSTSKSKTTVIKSPLLLRCGHTFCDSCMTQYAKKRMKGDKTEFKLEISCPSCKTQTLVPNNVNDLPINVYVAASLHTNYYSQLEQELNKFVPSPTKKLLQEALESKLIGRSSEGKLCDLCDERKASCECKECENILCSPCFKMAHKISAAIRHHKPVQLKQNLDESLNIEITCQEHNRPIEYFCKTDNTQICSRCFINGEHKQHDIQSFEEKNIEYIEEIDQELPTANTVLSSLKKIDKRILSIMPSFKHEAKHVIEEISANFLYLHSLLQVKESEMLKAVLKAYNDGLKLLEDKRSSCELMKYKLDNILKEAKRLSDNSSLIVDAKHILEELRNVKTIPCIVTDNSTTEGLKWEAKGSSDVLNAIFSYGSLYGEMTDKIKFKTFEEQPIELSCDDDDTASVSSLTSTISNQSIASFKRSGSISSKSTVSEDAGFDNDTDGDNCRTRSSKAAKEVITIPMVRGPQQRVIITHIHSPGSFYVQMVSNRKKIETLSHNMNTWCRSTSANKHIPLTLQKNMLVLAKYSQDNEWYRARVISVEFDDDDEKQGFQIWIMYLDFGNEERVEIKNLRTMQDRFMIYPEFRVYCSLYDIAPLSENNTWEEDTVKEFAKITENKMMMMNTLGKDVDSYSVDLTYMPTENVSDDLFVSVRDVLIFLELARFHHHSDQAKIRTQKPSYSKEDYISSTAISSSCLKEIEEVTNAESPDNFYVMLKGQERDYYKAMMEQIQNFYNGKLSNLLALYYPRCGALCVAKGADGNWYRAKVVEAPKQKLVKVCLVDIGEEIIVHYDWLRKIHHDFVKLPIQAVNCKLADIVPEDEQWSDEIKLWCKTVLTSSCGTAKFVSWGSPSNIVFWLGQDDAYKNNSINALLVSNGFAQSTGPASIPTSASEMLPIKPQVYGMRRTLSTSSSSSRDTITRTPSTSPQKNKTAVSKSSSSPRKPVARYSIEGDDRLIGDQQPTIKDEYDFKNIGKKESETNENKTDNDNLDTEELINMTKIGKKRPPIVSKKLSMKAEYYRKNSQKNKMSENAEALNDNEEESIKNKDIDVKEEPNKSPYIQVLMSDYSSPSDFKIRIRDKEQQLAHLMTSLQKVCQEEVEPITVQENLSCSVRNSKDKKWYRGLIRKIDEPESIQVEIVDYGWNIVVSDLNDLKPLSPVFCKTECAAIRCFIADLVPAGSMDSKKWSKTAIDFMSGQIFEKNLYVKMMGDVCDDGVPVDLIIEEVVPETAFEPASQTFHSLRQLILDDGLALPSKNPSPLPSPDSINPFFRTIFGQGVKSISKEENKNDGITSQIQETNTQETETIPQRFVKVYELPEIPPPCKGCQIEVIPTYVGYDGVIFAQRVDWETQILEVTEILQTIYKDARYTPVLWEQSQLCVARFPDDNLWYRAQVKEIKPDSVKVVFLDYGNSAWVALQDVREITDFLAELHPLVLKCVLHEAEPCTGDGMWPTEVLNLLHDVVVNSLCSLVIHDVLPNSLILGKLTTDAGVEFPQYLFDKNLARDAGDMTHIYRKSLVTGEVWNKQNPYTLLDVPETGTEFHAAVTAVELPDLIYLQRIKIPESEAVDIVTSGEIAENNRSIAEFEEMSEALNVGISMPLVDLPEVGMRCAGKYSVDNCWYRALCVEQHPKTDSCYLLFVDFGTPEEIPRTNIRSLPREFWTIPAQAIRCSFNIIPPFQQRAFRLPSLYAVIEAITDKELFAKVTSRNPTAVDLLERMETGELRLAYEEVITDCKAQLPEIINERNIPICESRNTSDNNEVKEDSPILSTRPESVTEEKDQSDQAKDSLLTAEREQISKEGSCVDWFDGFDEDGNANEKIESKSEI